MNDRPRAHVPTPETRRFHRELIATLESHYPGGYKAAAAKAPTLSVRLPANRRDLDIPLPDWPGVAALLNECGGEDVDLEGLYDLWRRGRESQPDDPPPPGPDPRGSRRGPVVGAAIVLVLAAVVAVAVVFHPRVPPGPPDPPPIARAGTCYPDVLARGPECVGITDGRFTFPSSPGLAPVLSRIAKENDRVHRGSVLSVSVAYVVALPRDTADDAGRLALATARAELEGAADAQQRINGRGGVPQVRLLVVNTGQDGALWGDVLDGLTAQVRRPNRLVAVAGLGGNRPSSAAMAHKLVEAGIPVFASRLTTEPDLVARRGGEGTAGMLEAEAAVALAGASGPVLVVRDGNRDDPYVQQLGTAAETEAARRGRLVPDPGPRDFKGGTPGVSDAFASIAQGVCVSGVNTIYFAGRADDLAAFLPILDRRPCRTSTPMTVLTGDDAADLVTALRRDPVLGRDGGENSLRAVLRAGISLRYTPGVVAPQVADDAFGEAAAAFARPAECARRTAEGRTTPPTPYGPDAITAGSVTQRCLSDGLPPGVVPLLAVTDPETGRTTPVPPGVGQ